MNNSKSLLGLPLDEDKKAAVLATIKTIMHSKQSDDNKRQALTNAAKADEVVAFVLFQDGAVYRLLWQIDIIQEIANSHSGKIQQAIYKTALHQELFRIGQVLSEKNYYQALALTRHISIIAAEFETKPDPGQVNAIFYQVLSELAQALSETDTNISENNIGDLIYTARNLKDLFETKLSPEQRSTLSQKLSNFTQALSEADHNSALLSIARTLQIQLHLEVLLEAQEASYMQTNRP
jgi:hypothetical protein